MNSCRNNKINWSFSKSKLHANCPRSFFLKGIDQDITIGELVPLRAIIGLAVHNAIANQISNWIEEGFIDSNQAQTESEYFIRELWDDPHGKIIEVHNGLQLDAEIFSKFIFIARNHLKNFFRMIWPRFEKQEYIIHEALDNYTFEGITAYVKIDLCTRDLDGKLIITDWKTDKTDFLSVDSIQLDVYSHWAFIKKKEQPSNIILQMVNLNNGEFFRRSPSINQLNNISNKIRDEIKIWSELNLITDFQPKPSFDNCIGCLFLFKCEVGREKIRSQNKETLGYK